MKSNDDFFNFNGNDEGRGNVGLRGHDEGNKTSRPSINELFNRQLKDGEDDGKENGDLVEQFNQSDEFKQAIKS